MIHELSHSKLHHNSINRNAVEVEAESIAYVVSNHFNIDTSSIASNILLIGVNIKN